MADDTTDDYPVEPRFLDEPPLSAGFEQELARQYDIPFYDLPNPDGVYSLREERLVDLAERVLSAPGRDTGLGHHVEIQRSMEEWAPARDEDVDGDPGYWRRIAFSLTPNERNFGQLEPASEDSEDVAGVDSLRLKKARTVLAWADSELPDEVCERVEQQQVEDLVETWEGALEGHQKKRAYESFADDPPEEMNGWQYFDADHGAVGAAYRGENHGVPSVAAAFEKENGEMDCVEVTHDEWQDVGGNPREAKPNRVPIVKSGVDGDGPYVRLWSHLQMFSADPLPVDADDERTTDEVEV